MSSRKKLKRSNNALVKNVAIASQSILNDDSVPHSSDSPLSVGHGQTSAFLSLASELLLEILSYFPPVPKRAWIRESDAYLSSLYCERPNVLRALSQTCRAARKFFLPLLWERLEVCTARLVRAWHLQVSATLEARSIGLAQRQDLSAYVR
jgi:hypothetical protein